MSLIFFISHGCCRYYSQSHFDSIPRGGVRCARLIPGPLRCPARAVVSGLASVRRDIVKVKFPTDEGRERIDCPLLRSERLLYLGQSLIAGVNVVRAFLTK